MEQSGQLIDGRYRLQRLVGEGGVAEVWLATDEALQRQVALKVLRAQYTKDEQLLERFRREATLVAQLDSPHIVQVFGVDTTHDPRYIVMEWVDGQDLRELLRFEAPLSVESALRLLRDVAAGVAVAHEAGMVHRDLKPANVLLSRRGEVKITDFGIARDTAGAGLTEPGKVWGTSHYLAPEQAAGQSVSPATDVYAMGVMLFEMVTGRVPFPGDDPVAVAIAHIRETPPDVQTLNPSVPSGVARLIRRMMDKAPERRPSDGGVLVQILDGYLNHAATATTLGTRVEEPVAAAALPRDEAIAVSEPRVRQPRPAPSAATPRSRGPLVPLLVGGLLVLLLGFSLWRGIFAGRSGEVPAASGGGLPTFTPAASGGGLPTFTLAASGTSAPTVAATLPATLAATEVAVVPPPATRVPPSATATASATPTATATATATPPLGPLREGNGPDARARHLQPGSAIRVNGSLNEWVADAIPLVNPVYGRERWGGYDDLSGQARFAWDESFLYLAIERTDDSENYQPDNFIGGDLYRGDAVELWLDADLVGDFAVKESNDDDFQFAFSAGNFQSGRPPEAFVYYPTRNDDWNAQVRVGSEPLPNGYTMEVAIPWSLIEVVPAANTVLGYAVLLNDNDLPYSNDVQTQVVSNVAAPYLQPQTFGNLILLP